MYVEMYGYDFFILAKLYFCTAKREALRPVLGQNLILMMPSKLPGCKRVLVSIDYFLLRPSNVTGVWPNQSLGSRFLLSHIQSVNMSTVCRINGLV